MNKMIGVMTSLALGLTFSSGVWANEQECQKLQTQHDLIYAAKGFCFEDKDRSANACKTNKPKFSSKEQAKLDEIKARQKELSCKVKD